MQTKKMSLANIQGKLSRTEMKNIMAGSTCTGGTYSACTTGNRCCWHQGKNWGYGGCGGAYGCCTASC